MNNVFLLHFLSTCVMTGLIWLVQLVHYPAFHSIDPASFKEFHAFHSQRISWIVMPVMVIELLTAVLLLYQLGGTFWTINLVAVGLLWLATAFLSVPLHNQLASGMNHELIEQLVWTNWPRTLIWTARVIALTLLALGGKPSAIN